MDRNGQNREVYATGIRNSVGFDFNPKNSELWFTDNQVDGMGDDMPPGNSTVRRGQAELRLSVVWRRQGADRGVEGQRAAGRRRSFPQLGIAAHAAILGMTFYHGKMFPEKYQGGIFIAQHGSWNRTVPIGARIMFTYLKPDGSADKFEPFAEGWLNNDTGEYSGRPVDVAQLADGSLLVSDDYAGAIYRISYSVH